MHQRKAGVVGLRVKLPEIFDISNLDENYAFGDAIVNEANASDWMVGVRAHRDFLP